MSLVHFLLPGGSLVRCSPLLFYPCLAFASPRVVVVVGDVLDDDLALAEPETGGDETGGDGLFLFLSPVRLNARESPAVLVRFVFSPFHHFSSPFVVVFLSNCSPE